MTIKWKSKKNLKPEHVLEKINDMIITDTKGNIAFQGFEYHEAVGSIYSMVDFPKSIRNDLECDTVISQGISKAAKLGPLNKASVISCINDIARLKLSTSEKKYALLTSISISDGIPFKYFNINSCRVSVTGKHYPKKYNSRSGVLKENHKKLKISNDGYSKIIVYCQSKTHQGAASKALDSLDIARAIICLFSNYGSELIGDRLSPINRVMLGEVHSLHKNSGKAINDIYWFEPNFTNKPVLSPQKPEILKRNFNNIVEKIKTSPYESEILESLLRYVRALDESDQNIAVIRAWNALEKLLCPNGENFDKIPSRCAFLFEEEKYHQQVLEHIRESRNENVHISVNNQNAKNICYQIQFYYREVLFFLLRMSNYFKSLEEANQFMDFPTNEEKLKTMKERIEKAMKFRKIEL